MKKFLFGTLFIIAFNFISWMKFSKKTSTDFKKEATAVLSQQVLEEAAWALQQQPITVTAESSSRSAGGKHDFYSEGDYWWPSPISPDSPYIQ